MSLAQGCNGGGFTSGVTTLAEALAKPIGEIHVQAVFPQVNTTVKNGAGTEYPTGFTRGSVIFETRTNQLFVNDIPTKLEEVSQLIAK